MIHILRRSYVFLIYVFLYAPILVLVALSFNKAKYMHSWTGFTLKWYASLFGNSDLINAAVHSLMVASLSATIATVMGTLGATAMRRRAFVGRTALKAVLSIIMLSPDIVMGVSLLIVFVSLNLSLGFFTLLASHVTFCLPFVMVTVNSRLAGFDRHVTEAAMDLGADELATFRYVILPMAAPAVLAGWLLSFTLSLDDVIISFFVTGPTFEILPLKIYSMVKMGVKPTVNALSAIMVLGTVGAVFAAQLLLRGKK